MLEKKIQGSEEAPKNKFIKRTDLKRQGEREPQGPYYTAGRHCSHRSPHKPQFLEVCILHAIAITVSVCMKYVGATVHVWRPEDKFLESTTG
jgi:hypothetical protein